MPLSRRRFTHAAALSGLSLLPVSSHAASAFPSKPLRIVVPLTPGSSSDSVSRYLAEKLGQELRQPVTVENRPGGDTLIATQHVLQSPADGHTMLMVAPGAMVINPLLKEPIGYKPEDLRMLVGAIRNQAVVVAPMHSPHATLADALADARSSPGRISMATYSPHYRLASLRLQGMAKLQFNEVSYKGAAQMQTDVIGGAVDLGLFDLGGTLPLIRSGKLKALAVTGHNRHPLLPGVPTVAESGVPGFESYVWIGYAVRADVPDEVARELESALLKVARQPAFKAFVDKTAFGDVTAWSGAKSWEVIRQETEITRRLIQQHNFQMH